MRRKTAFMAVVALLLAYDQSAKSDAQPSDWLFPGGAGLSASNAQIWPESKGHPRIASRLTQTGGTISLPAQPGPAAAPLTESLSGFARFDQQGRVQVYITLSQVNESTLNALRDVGVEIDIYDASQRLVQGWIAPLHVQAVADLPSVTFVDLPNYGTTNAGSVMTQGDAVIRTDEARALRGVMGSGVKVGVLSDGIANLTESVASGNLPASGVTVPAAPLTGGGISLDSPLPGGTTLTVTPVGRSDLISGAEGTAMLEIIHDIAPNAQLFFAPGGTTLADQRAIRWLKSQGVKVIADDHSFFNVGPYDGTSAVSQEMSNAVADGVSYFVAAGNQAQQHYRGLFTDTDGDTFHEFDASLGLPRVDNAGETLNVTVQPFGIVSIALQWNDPFGGSTNNFDLCVHDPADIPASPPFCSTNLQTGTQNPTEVLAIISLAPTPLTFGVSIHRVGGAAPRMFDLFILGGVMNEFVVPSGSVPNKSDAGGGVISVGAVDWQAPNEIEFFSSRGPTSDGRVKPELVAPDGVITSVAGFTPFFGTSAAVPHAAGAAALVLDAKPTITSAQLSAQLTHTAIPLDSPVPNNTSGFGRIDALQAVSSLGATLTVTKAGTGTGIVSSTPPGINCGVTCTADFAIGTAVNLIATPDPGSLFSGWGGDCDAAGNVTMDADRACTATFSPGPDLIGTWNPVSQSCRKDKCKLKGSVRVVNQGTATAPASHLRVLLSDDAVLDPSDAVLKESKIKKLKPGRGTTSKIKVTLPPGVNAAGKYLFAVVDAFNAAAELVETNNVSISGSIP